MRQLRRITAITCQQISLLLPLPHGVFCHEAKLVKAFENDFSKGIYNLKIIVMEYVFLVIVSKRISVRSCYP